MDAILSYPWLEKACLGVFPHLGMLVRLPEGEKGDPILLSGWPRKNKRKQGGPRLDPASIPNTRPRRLLWSRRLSALAKRCREDVEHVANIARVRAMQLTIPNETGEEEDSLFEDEDVLDYLATHIKETRPNAVWGVITVPEGQAADDQTIKELVEAIHRDFDGTVLREDVPPENIIPRGPHGEGRIKIKPGYPAKIQRPIHLVGERRDALIELVHGWMRDDKVKRVTPFCYPVGQGKIRESKVDPGWTQRAYPTPDPVGCYGLGASRPKPRGVGRMWSTWPTLLGSDQCNSPS